MKRAMFLLILSKLSLTFGFRFLSQPITAHSRLCYGNELFMNRKIGSTGNEPNDQSTVNPTTTGGENGQKYIFLQRWYDISEETRSEIKTSLATFAIALMVRILMVEPRYIPSLSMFPTFDIGDQLLVDKVSHYRKPYQKRDVVVFNPTEIYKDMTGNNEALIKRIVATAGDTVEVKNNRLFVNGIVQDETYVNDYPDYTLPPTEVPAGMLLVLGDNRNHSFDSHVWGFLPEKNVIGRAFVKYWPPWRAGIVEGSS